MSNYTIYDDMTPTNSYYGGYRTRTFTEIFTAEGDEGATYEEFARILAETPFAAKLADVDTELLFYMLYARYGNSHIAFSDENQFIFSLFTMVFQYGPTWAKRLHIQEQLRAIKDEDLVLGGHAIYNHAYNPSTEPSTEVLDYINEQNTTNFKKSKMEGYAILMDLLDTDVSEEFLTRFRKLFIKVLAPDRPLLYETTIMEDN